MVCRTTAQGKPERSEWWETAWFWNHSVGLVKTEPPKHREHFKEVVSGEAAALIVAPGKFFFGLQFNWLFQERSLVGKTLGRDVSADLLL